MNIKELRDNLAEDFTQMKDGEMSLPLGKARASTAGKIVSSSKVELEYNKQVGQADKKIPFLEVS